MAKAAKGPQDARAPLSNNSKIMGYIILGQIGKGGFGIVYKAWHPTFQETAAIKEYFPETYSRRSRTRLVRIDDKSRPVYDFFLEKFRETTGLLRGLDHPNIVKVSGYEEANNTGYMLMDYVEGVTLERWLRDQESIDPEQIRSLMRPVFHALDYLHSKNLYHRDISPINIMKKNTDGEPVIIDFGALKHDLAKEGRDTPGSYASQANPDYAPVEQTSTASSFQIGPYTDVYSTSATLYHLIAGRPPEKAEDRKSRIAEGRPDSYVPIGENATVQMSEHEFAAIDKALSYLPTERYQTVKDFAEGLGWDIDNLAGKVEPIGPIGEPRPDPFPRPIRPPPKSPGSKAYGKPSANKWMAPLAVGAIVTAVAAILFFGPFGSESAEADVCNERSSYDQLLSAKDLGKLSGYISRCSPVNGPFVEQAQLQFDNWTREDEKWKALDRSSLEALRAYLGEFRGGLHEKEARTVLSAMEVDDEKWAQVSGTGSIKRIQGYLDTYPNGRHAAEAMKQIADIRAVEQAAFEIVEFSRRIGDLEAFKRKFPDGELRVQADEQIAKLRSGESEHWKSIVVSNSIRVFEAYLERFPDGIHAPEANERIEKLKRSDAERDAWEQARKENTVFSYQNFLSRYPAGEFAAQAEAQIAKLENQMENEAWEKAQRQDTTASYREYLRRFPSGKFSGTAQERIRQLEDTGELQAWTKARGANSPEAIEEFLSQFPKGKFAALARATLQILNDDQAWLRAQRMESILALQDYLSNSQYTRHSAEAQSLLDSLRNVEYQLAQQAATQQSVLLAERYLGFYPLGIGRYRDKMEKVIAARSAKATCDTPDVPISRLQEMVREVLDSYYTALNRADTATAVYHFPTMTQKRRTSIADFAEARITSGIDVSIEGDRGMATATLTAATRAKSNTKTGIYNLRIQLVCESSRWQIESIISK